MKPRFLSSISIVALLLLSVLPAAKSAEKEFRTWTDLQGRQMQAALLDVSGDSLKIERDDGRQFSVNLGVFSEADRAYVQQWLQKQAMAAPPDLKPWPTRIQTRPPRAEVVEEGGDRFHYRTEHFEFFSDVRLSRTLIEQLGILFESTFAAVESLPIGLDISAPPEGRFQARLFADIQDYHRAGGIPGSAGLYVSAIQTILIPIEFLGAQESSSGFSFDRHGDNRTLIHEITHQVMHPWIGKIPVWLAEGLAGYMETIPYERGTFRFDRQDLEAHLLRYTAYRRDGLPLVPLSELLDQSYSGWTGAFAHEASAVSQNYTSALLLTYFFLHLENDRTNIVAYLHAIKHGTPEPEARALLLAGRQPEDLQAEMVTAFRRIGIRLTVP